MKILVAGDFCPRGQVNTFIEDAKYENVLGEVKEILDGGGYYSIVNFECTVVESDAQKINKSGTCLKCSRKAIAALKWAGFNCLTLANNHFNDYGAIGINNTFKVIDEYGLDRVGAGKNISDAAKVLYKRIDNKILAIVNCCEHEFSVSYGDDPGCNGLNPIRQYYTIQDAQKEADYVLVIVHGGHEHWQLPSPRMQETYRFFIDAGADAVVNGHQHCYSGYELYKGKQIFYGLGNFCFEWGEIRERPWTQGYMVVLNVDNNDFEIIPYDQCGKKVGVTLLPRTTYDEKIEQLNSIIRSESVLKAKTKEYYNQCKLGVRHILNPIQNHLIKGAMNRGWIPDGLKKEWFKSLENHVLCESHLDKIIYFLKNYE